MRSYVVERLTGVSGAAEHVIKVAQAMGQRALPLFLKQLNDRVSSPIEIEVKSVEVGRQPEMLDIAGRYDALVMAGSEASADALILLIDSAAIAVLVNALFGGDPQQETSPIKRDLSPTEREIAALAFEQVAQALNGSGSRSLNLRFPLPGPTVGADLKKLTLRDGPSVRITYSIFTPASAGTLTVSMPQRVLLQFRAGPESENAAAGSGRWSTRFSDEVMRSAVRVEARIPIGRMTLGELAMMFEGQVIEMPASAQGDTRLVAKDKMLFVGEFGKLGQNYTIRISHPFDAGQELMDGILPA